MYSLHIIHWVTASKFNNIKIPKMEENDLKKAAHQFLQALMDGAQNNIDLLVGFDSLITEVRPKNEYVCFRLHVHKS